MKPVIHESAFVAENATVRGSVTIGPEAGIYFGAVLRAETAPITVGEGANIQDNCVVHADPGFPAVIGRGAATHAIAHHKKWEGLSPSHSACQKGFLTGCARPRLHRSRGLALNQ